MSHHRLRIQRINSPLSEKGIGSQLWLLAVGDSAAGHLESELSEWLTTELPSPDGALFLSPPPQ